MTNIALNALALVIVFSAIILFTIAGLITFNPEAIEISPKRHNIVFYSSIAAGTAQCLVCLVILIYLFFKTRRQVRANLPENVELANCETELQ